MWSDGFDCRRLTFLCLRDGFSWNLNGLHFEFYMLLSLCVFNFDDVVNGWEFRCVLVVLMCSGE